MSQHWGPPPPPVGDPWGGAARHYPGQGHHHPNLQQTVLGNPGGPPWERSQPGVRPPAAPPRLWPTVVVTLFFGLFGLIPAAVAAGRARDLGAPTGPYWRAFGVIFGAMLIVQALILVFVVAPVLRTGLVPSGTRPTSAAYDDTAAPSTRLPVTRAPVTQAPATQAPRTTFPAPPPAPPAEQSTTRTVTSLPSGTWITVLDSMPKSQRGEGEAWAMADGLSGSAPVVVVDSDRISGLNGGYWAIAITGSSSRNEANGWCSVINRPVGGTCYPRQVG